MDWQLPAGSATVLLMVFPLVCGAFLQLRNGTWEERSLLDSGSLCCLGKQQEGRKGFRLMLLGANLLVFRDLLILTESSNKSGRADLKKPPVSVNVSNVTCEKRKWNHWFTII